MTTIATIAEAADVSVETVYKACGGKWGLVRAIWTKAWPAPDPIPQELRSDEMLGLEGDPRKVIENGGP